MNAPFSFTGDLIKEPDLKYTQTGKAVCNLVLKISEKSKQQTIIPVTCWETLAESCAECLSKGDHVIVMGYLKSNIWTDKHEQKRDTKVIQAIAVGLDLRYVKVDVTQREKREEEGGEVSYHDEFRDEGHKE